MNCAVCGNPLLLDRVAFHCACGVFVHAHCWDKHVLQAHQPTFEMGAIDLDGNFIANEKEKEIDEAPVEQAAASEEE